MYQQTASGLLLPNSVSESVPERDQFKNLGITAENGLVIFYRPTADGGTERKALSVADAESRRQYIIRHYNRCRELGRDHAKLKDRLSTIADCIERLEAAMNLAKEQGPFEFADMRRARVRAAKKTVAVGGNTNG